MSWNPEQVRSRVREAIKATNSIEVVNLTREIDLANAQLPLSKAYRVDGVHAYLDIVNADELLESTETESERSHKRFVRYLNILSRVLHATVLTKTDVFKIDQQNHRLHLLQFKPYDDERKRIACMVSVMRALHTLLAKVDALHGEFSDAKVCVGVESGVALAVTNGTRGDRELLFLGPPANHAAKLLCDRSGIFLGDRARSVLGNDFRGSESDPLTTAQLDALDAQAGLGLDVDRLLAQWKEELSRTALSDVQFVRPTPPLSALDVVTLTPANSRRFEGVAFMADIDGFTKFVAKRIADKRGEAEAVQVLHVIRKELRDVLNDAGGRKVRYIGDCLQGAAFEGSKATDEEASVNAAMDIASRMRSSFAIIHEELAASKELGLAIGVEYGPLLITRVGVKTNRDRVIAGRALMKAEEVQRACGGRDTGFGPVFRRKGDAVAKRIFESDGERLVKCDGVKLVGLDVNKLDALRRDARVRSGGGGSPPSSGSLPVKPHQR
ncbi:MAG: adenylate/guanylate cyclase domain-containing protein [Deltaproteobacteria bacterium]|nr:adenylate/guanylate cyclase domain-containing protein [Deltaproteobacteria bacterium]